MAVTINTLRDYKRNKEKFSALTAYDAAFSHMISEAGVDVLLIGDSLGMVLQGHETTLPVSVDDIAYHVSCVARGNQGALIMADMPFMSYANQDQALRNAARLMQAGAHMVKLEGTDWLVDSIRTLSERGVPVCAHLGLTPQFVNKFGGYKVQGRGEREAGLMVQHARMLVRPAPTCCSWNASPPRWRQELPKPWTPRSSASAPALKPTARFWSCTTCWASPRDASPGSSRTSWKGRIR